jgi:hypothetical protein
VNASEREVAEALTALHVAWEYEPRLFILETDERGNILKGFRPDFYLTKYDFFIEVTRAKQPNTTEKKHKARLAKELYPGTRIEFIYRTHFKDLESRVKKLLQLAKDGPELALG